MLANEEIQSLERNADETYCCPYCKKAPTTVLVLPPLDAHAFNDDKSVDDLAGNLDRSDDSIPAEAKSYRVVRWGSVLTTAYVNSVNRLAIKSVYICMLTVLSV